MKNFNYRRAADLKSALAILAEEKSNAWVIAGGTNVLPDIRGGKKTDKTLVDIRGIEALRGIKYSRGKIVLGALTTIRDLEKSEIIQTNAHGLWQATLSFADPNTRNSATVGGNICNCSPAADTVTPLLALDAVLTLEKRGGMREVALKDFFTGKGSMVLEEGELLTKITFKKAKYSAFIKLGLRKAMSIAAANVGVSYELEGNKMKEVKVAMGCLSPFPTRCASAEAVLEGKEYNEELMAEMGEALVANDIQPHTGMRATAKYRRQVAPVLVARALKAASSCNNGGAK